MVLRPLKIQHEPKTVTNSYYNSYLGCLTSIKIISSSCIFIAQQKLDICLGYKIYQIFFSLSFVNFIIFAFSFIFFLVLVGFSPHRPPTKQTQKCNLEQNKYIKIKEHKISRLIMCLKAKIDSAV